MDEMKQFSDKIHLEVKARVDEAMDKIQTELKEVKTDLEKAKTAVKEVRTKADSWYDQATGAYSWLPPLIGLAIGIGIGYLIWGT